MTHQLHALAQTHLENTTFTVFRAKGLYSAEWESSELRDQVGTARESYRIYSPTIPCFDAYDDKSAVYAVRATYPLEYQGEQTVVEEWVTLRFVPADGTPALSEDLKHYVISSGGRSSSILDLISTKLFTHAADALQNIYTYSRFSACRPQAEVVQQQWVVNAYWQNAGIRTRNKWTAVAFALMNQAFLQDISGAFTQPIVLTAQINPKVEESVFLSGLRKHSPKITQVFPYAYQALELPNPQSVRLHRSEYGNYFYRFPGYFFSVTELIAALDELVESGSLASSTLEQYLDLPWQNIKKAPNYQHLNRLGELLTLTGQIPKSQISGEQLRHHLDLRVSDGVQLRLVTQQSVEHICQNILAAAVPHVHQAES